MAVPGWVEEFVGSLDAKRDAGLIECARKLVEASALNSLWRNFEKCAEGGEFFDSPDSYLRLLLLNVKIGLDKPEGYRGMSPANLDAWREKTQKAAVKLLASLMDGYPEISERRDEANLSDRWVTDAALNIATNGETDRLEDLIPAIEAGLLTSDRFAVAFASVSKLPLILTHLISWLDHDAALGHTVTHASIKNVHRNSFIRRLTNFFELHLGSPMRAQVFAIAELFFDMGELGVEDIKKIAPSSAGGGIPKVFIGNEPG